MSREKIFIPLVLVSHIFLGIIQKGANTTPLSAKYTCSRHFEKPNCPKNCCNRYQTYHMLHLIVCNSPKFFEDNYALILHTIIFPFRLFLFEIVLNACRCDQINRKVQCLLNHLAHPRKLKQRHGLSFFHK